MVAKKHIPLLLLIISALTISAQTIDICDTLTQHVMRGTYYSDIFVGRRTSNGEIFSQDRFTAACRDIPLGTLVEVSNMSTGMSVIVKINDRCRYHNNIDMTRTAHKALGLKGTQQVYVRAVGVAAGYPPPPCPDSTELPCRSEDQVQTESKNTEKKSDVGGQDSDTDNVKPTRKDDSETSNKTTATEALTQLYDIQLCAVKSHKTAESKAKLLPTPYQDNTVIRKKKQYYILILNIALPKKEAEKIRLRLSKSYKNAKIIRH